MSAAPHSPALILASASPRRSELLRQLTSDFEIITANTDEIQPEHLSPAEICQVNAHRKAVAVAKSHPDRIVLAADTLVFLGTRVYGKPGSMAQALEMLRELQGRAHSVITGVCLAGPRPRPADIFAEITTVRFKPLSKEAIACYHKLVNPLDKAGAYGIQEHGEQIIESIEGSYSNVVGLPLERLKPKLAELLR
ncbi:MAG: septum formation protein Maf [Verrucomicrobia bacterium]|nr:septum formation protein Maf [Verrucomicrobiota bacterium]MBI3869052.1 septum formation protein Maf [Verrucomicrobiota bacterium]